MKETFRKYRWITLVIIPLFIVGLSLVNKHVNKEVYINSVDCRYAYLYNGLNLGNGRFILGHIDHPGTPIQVVYAITSRITHQLTDSDKYYTQAVIENPEKYLSVAMYVLTLINGLFLFLTGFLCFKLLDNIYYALLIQGIVLTSGITFSISNYSNPEMFACTVLLIGVLALGYINNRLSDRKLTFYSSLAGSFLLSLKITFGAYLLVPLFLIPRLKNKLLYIFYTFFFYLAFAFPVTLQGRKYLQWLTDLITREGRYGTGDKVLFNAEKMAYNLKYLFTQFDFLLFFVLNAIGLILVIYVLKKEKKTGKERNIIKTISGILVANTALLIFVLKQFSPYYLLPSLYFGGILLVCMLMLGQEYLPQLITNKRVKYFTLIFIPVFIFRLGLYSKTELQEVKNEKLPYFETLSKVKPFERDTNFVKIIVPEYNGAALPQYAHHFGTIWSGKENEYFYHQFLKKTYPYSYIFDTKSPDFIYHWDNKVSFRDVFCLPKNKLLYIEGNQGRYRSVLKALNEIGLRESDFTLEYHNKSTNEYLLFMQNDSVNCHPSKTIELLCQFEPQLINNGKCYFNDTSYYYDGFWFPLVPDHEVPGNHHVHFKPDMLYGPTLKIPYQPHMKISVDLKVTPANASLISVISPYQSSEFYNAKQNQLDLHETKWSFLSHNYTLPKVEGVDSVLIYTWNKNGEEVFIDDMKIVLEEF
ncbi:MAG: hypothetical protein MI922_08430 [Bacteroidales bacterium]|nr:hypothetical protein [Bacteroidales bacterium]